MSNDKQQELFDIYDDRMNRIGTATRTEAHTQGLWHATFQCWLWYEENGEVYVLFQERHPDKDTFPGLLDISCAGHLLAGESPEDGVRELEEELGVTCAFEELHSCGIYAESDEIRDGLIDREYCHVYVLHSERPLASYHLQPDEVTGLYALRLEHVKLLASGLMLEPVRISGVKPDESGTLVNVERLATQEQFVPHAQSYYELVMRGIQAQRGR
ncbi:NUDIX domain-containing protein [Paenibacillus sp. YYML68]|uniref:NUDIX hydrolase n=1 Tax=Paenibacillus sp. YYML68 TaxID=2909250 RepID=UPI002492E498|nr:NUDIX domain-containing protein [Paenibacillus sp. YYML68]